VPKLPAPQFRSEIGWRFGNLTIDEVCQLKPRSRSGFYADVKAGLVQIRKQGRNSIVSGPVARRYINGCTHRLTGRETM